VPIFATQRFVLSRNTSIKLKRIAGESGAKWILKIVLTMSALPILIIMMSNTARGNTNMIIHQLSNSRIQKMLPLVKLMSNPAPKPFVITMNSRRWPPAMLSMGPKKRKKQKRIRKKQKRIRKKQNRIRKKQNRIRKPLLMMALVTSSYTIMVWVKNRNSAFKWMVIKLESLIRSSGSIRILLIMPRNLI